MLIMLDKRQKIIMPTIQVQAEVFRSMKVEVTSKTPYTDATQVSRIYILTYRFSFSFIGSTRLQTIS